MFLNKPAVKSYARQVKRKFVLPKRLNPIEFDLSNSHLLNESNIANSAAKRDLKKTKLNSSNRKRRKRCSVLALPKGVKHGSHKIIQRKSLNNSIFNDSLPFEESPFSKIAKTVRKDMGLKFVGLDNYESPYPFKEVKSVNSSSGCVSNSSIKTSVSRNSSSVSSSRKTSLPVTPKLPVTKVPETVTIRKRIVADIPSLSPETGFLGFSSLDVRERDLICLSPDFIEGTPTPPCLISRVWGKAFKKKRQAILFTSTPLGRTNFSSKSQEEKSFIKSGGSSIGSGSFKDMLLVNSRCTSLSPESRCEVGNIKSKCDEKSQSSSIAPIDSFLGTAKEVVLQVCRQLSDIDFSSYITERSPAVLEKIGEGVFSEVFGCLSIQGTRSVWKVQPFEGDLIFNGEEQKKSADILSEILITSSLSDLRKGEKSMTEGFVKALDFKCVRCPFPKVLLDCWQKYDDKKGSENDCPSVFPDNQLMLITELEYAGVALEDFVFSSAPQALSVFTQVAYALAVAEIELEFEHRDLHWGNIMVFKTPAQEVNYVLDGERITLNTRGVVAKIVDFTLSRATIDGRFHYADLADSPEIFESTGEYQFEIYRLMREHTNNVWGKFSPYTNVLWLHYLILQMCKGVKYKNKKAQIHHKYMKKIVDISSHILEFTSALHYVSVQNYYPAI
ncbi:serine/threonine-protein kinase haspin-like [Hetaerina americana]|uniref:serine/threonine-protein kinase haspin-like n=1 Tax=Hetaerina americana TaxID=62018 RepID=UPI003A7F52F0